MEAQRTSGTKIPLMHSRFTHDRPHGTNGHNNKRRRERATDNREERNAKTECSEKVNVTVIIYHLENHKATSRSFLRTDCFQPYLLCAAAAPIRNGDQWITWLFDDLQVKFLNEVEHPGKEVDVEKANGAHRVPKWHEAVPVAMKLSNLCCR